MTIPLTDFLSQVFSNPMLAVTVALTLGVIMVNGWTDAPNAIATCVSTRSMRAPNAIIMAAVQLPRRARDDAHQLQGGHDHLQHGGLWRQHA